MEPLGIDSAKPRFSWVTSSTARDVQQSSYRLRVASSAAELATGDVWDSGAVATAESASIEYAGAPLEAATTYYWSVDVQTSAGAASASSTFATGLLADADWGSSAWIGRDRVQQSADGLTMKLDGASWIHPPYGGGNTPPGYFRQSFTLPLDKTIERAEFVMAGDRGFTANLNGSQIATGKSVDDAWKKATRVQVFPNPGTNLLAVYLSNTAKAYGAVLGKLTVRFTDGTTQDVVTDGTWLSNKTANTGWQSNGYDTTGWVPATARAIYGGDPWGSQVTVPPAATADSRLSFDTASWIIPAIGTPSLPSNPIPSTVFRKSLTVSATKEIAWAQLAATGDQIFTAYWNGTKVAFNSGLNNEWQTARVTNIDAVAGENVLGLVLKTPGNSVNGGVLATVRVGYTDGTSEQIITNSGFTALATAEDQAPAGWNIAGYTETAAWKNAQSSLLYRNGIYGAQVTIPELSANADALTFANSDWIWTPEAGAPVAPGEDRAFRKPLDSPAGKQAKKAEIFITADDSYQLWINGRLIARTEGASNEWQGSKRYVVDLDGSKNVIAVRTTNGAGSAAGLLMVGRVSYDDLSSTVFTTDASWKASKTITDGFEKPGFNDSGWAAAAVQARYGSGPWGGGVRLPVAAPAAAPLMRKEFTVDQQVTSAKIYTAAGGYANVSLNGAPINDEMLSPGFTDYDDHAQYTVTDLTSQLKQGGNALGIELGRGFYGLTNGNVWNWEKAPFHDEPVAKAVLRIEYADGTTKDVVTDGSWTLHDGPTVLDDLYGGETYDASHEQTGFDTVGFADSSWDKAAVVAGPKGTLVNQSQQPIRVTEELPAASVTEVIPGTYVVKFPRVLAGNVQITATGDAGTTVRYQYAEKLRANGRLNADNNGGFQNGFQTDRFILAGTGEAETWAAKFSYKGFQYIEVSGWPAGSVPTVANFTAQALHTDTEETGSFESANSTMNATHRAVVDTLLNNLHGIPTDTPMFEKNGWTGDAAVGAEMFMMNLDSQNLFAKWIGDINDSRDPITGAPYVIAPSSANWGDWGKNPSWHAAYIQVPWTLYQYGGDIRVLQQYYDGMKQYTDAEFARSPGGIADARLGDWVSPEASPAGGNAPEDVHVSATAFLYTMLNTMEKTATLLGKPGDAEHFAGQASTVKDAFNAAFLDTKSGSYRGAGDRGYRQTHNVLALAFGMTPDAETATRVAASLAADVVAKGDKLNTGTLGTKYLLPMLTKYGYADLAYRVAVQKEYPSWGYMIENGATSMWEHWSLESRSLGHYFLGTVDDWFYHDVAGIRSSETTGYRDVSIAPQITDELDWAKATTKTPFGPVSVDWKKTGDALSLKTHVPVGATATVTLPAVNSWAVSEGGNALTDVAGVRSVSEDSGNVLVTIGSGDYSFDVNPGAGAVGAVLQSIDALTAQIDEQLTARELNNAQASAVAGLVAASRSHAADALTHLVNDDEDAAARSLAKAIGSLDAVNEWIAGETLGDATRAALGSAAQAARVAAGATVSTLLGVSTSAALVSPASKPGEKGAVTATVTNGGQGTISDVAARLDGVGDAWSASKDPVAIAATLAAGATKSAALEFAVPLDQVPGEVASTVAFSYQFDGQTIDLQRSLALVVDSAVTIQSAVFDPSTVAPGQASQLTVTVSNTGSQAAAGHLEVTAPDGWTTPLPTGDVLIPAASDAALTVPVFVPVGTDRASLTASVTARFVNDGVTFAQATAELTVALAPVTTTPVGYDHVDLGNATDEAAHGLTASSSSGINTEAGLTRRYAGHLTDNSFFEFNAKVEAGKPFVIRAIETYDRAQTKKYKVFVNGTEVIERVFSHTGGLGTETYEFQVDAALAASDTVRIKFQNLTDHGFYDPSIADVWTLPVAADTAAPQVTATADPSVPNTATGWYTQSPVGITLQAQDDRVGDLAIEYALGSGAMTGYSSAISLADEGEHALKYRATDVAGNASVIQSLRVKIDTVAPATTATRGAEFDGESARTSGTIRFGATDATSGVAETRYRVNRGEWKTGKAVTVTTAGAFTVDYASTDVAGNVEAARSITGTIIIPDVPKSTVSFDSQGGSTVAAVSVDNGTVIKAPKSPTRTGYTFAGWYTKATGGSKWNFTNTVTANVTAYAHWTVQERTVTFNAQGGSKVAAVSTDYNTVIKAPKAPTRTGYTFAGWYTKATGGSKWSFTAKVTTDATAYAHWTVQKRTVTFNAQGGSKVAAVSTNYNTVIKAPKAPTRSGYTFAGWYSKATGGSKWNFATKVTANATAYAHWAVQKRTITFNAQGGSKVAAVSTNYNTVIKAPKAPTRSGYVFKGWYTKSTGGTAWKFTAKVTTNATAYAHWAKK
ncbi:hypothetical protein GCM10022381_37050 [Leifsonia kafniensis]|uniref:alpha-L-rhamnosidase n=1 Tax=Leifsonia kafniensis TaxID=475957 RepID=A0ABP7L0K2_9MICO